MKLTRREWIGATAAAAGLNAQAASRPNIVLIMSDDQGYGDLSAHGNPVLKTPHLDKLASESIAFTRFYVSPVCAPTRASLLTGRYNLRSGVHGVTRGRETMRAGETTFAESLRDAGYRTSLVGKWHLGEHYPYVPHARGFDEFVGFRTGHWNRYFDAPMERNGKPISTKGFITDALTDEAIRFVRANRQRPFFLYLAYNAPHSPYQAPDANYKRFEGAGLDEPTRVVYAMIENLDSNIGRLRAALDQMGVAENTIFLFLTDNGANTERFNAGLRARKGSVYEGGVRVPLFVRWPAKWKAARKIDTLAAHIDLAPTLLDLCGVKNTAKLPIDGRSLRPLLEGSTDGWPDRIIFTHRDHDEAAPYPGAARTQRFNLINGKELYDVVADPGEKRDVAAEHPEVVKRLRSAYEAWFDEVARQCRFERLPIPVGYDEENPVTLPATQAYFDGQLFYRNKNGFAHDWIAGWTRTQDAVWWDIDVVRDGAYEVALRYVVDKAGSSMEVGAGGKDSVRATVKLTASDEPLPHRNIVPDRHYVDLDWQTLAMGRLQLPRGRTRLTVRATEIAGPEAMQLKEAVLRRV